MKQLKILSLLVVVVLLTGCLSPMIRFTISPDPIKIQKGQEKLDLTLKFRTSGFGLGYKVDKAIITIVEKNGDALLAPQTVDLSLSIPVVPFVKRDVPIKDIPLGEIAQLKEEALYEALKEKEYTLKVTIKGTEESLDSAKIVFE